MQTFGQADRRWWRPIAGSGRVVAVVLREVGLIESAMGRGHFVIKRG